MNDAIGRAVIDLLADLVGIDSQNPSLVTHGAGEERIADYLQEWARSNGLRAERMVHTPGRPSVILTAPGSGGGRRLLLCGHLDTVGLGGSDLRPRVEGDRMYGRGTYDMKAGLAAGLIAAREAARMGLRGDVVVAALADEENMSLGATEVLESVVADAAIVLEPTELAIAIAHRGFVWVEIEIVGEAAHGSRPHLGVDAITKMAPVLSALDKLNVDLATQTHPLLGSGFLHASSINGGQEPSSIPGRCTLILERRTLPGETDEDVMAQINRVLRSCGRRDLALRATAKCLFSQPPFETAADSVIAAVVSTAGQHSLGRELKIGGVSYWADSALISAAGIPTILFGPAGDGAHADDEWVSLSATVDTAKVLIEATRRFCDPDL